MTRGSPLSANVVLASGYYDNGSNAGVFYRNGNNNWNNDNDNVGFRAAV